MDIAVASEKLSGLNTGVHQRFIETAETLTGLTDDAVLSEWADVCVDITEAGWHGSEATLAYLTLSESLVHLGTGRLLAVGRFGCSLCQYSTEPGKIYFEGYQSLINVGRTDVFNEMETSGWEIHEKYSQASTLMGDYFKLATHIAISRTLKDILAWTDLVKQMIRNDRGILTRFIDLSGSSETIPWTFLKQLQQETTSGCMTCLEHYANLERACPAEFLTDLQPAMLRYVQGTHGLTGFYKALTVQRFTGAQGRELVRLLADIDDVRLATCLVNSSQELPLENRKIMQSWVAEGMIAAKNRIEAGEAFFNLESARSRELLSALKGQVHFVDCKRVLQLYTEAFCGWRLAIEAVSSKADGEAVDVLRELPGTDGRVVYLPESASYFPDQTQNFIFYKVALLHQLAFFEFGTFASIRESNRAIRSFPQVGLARQIFRTLEDARVDWQLEHKFRGAATAIKSQKAFALVIRQEIPVTRQGQLLEILTQASLGGGVPSWVSVQWRQAAKTLNSLANRLSIVDATVQDTIALIEPCFALLTAGLDLTTTDIEAEIFPEPVIFRGESDTDQIMINLALMDLEETLQITGDEEEMLSIATLIDPKNAEVAEIKKGDLQDAVGMLMTDLDLDGVEEIEGEEGEELRRKFNEGLKGIANQGRQNLEYRYDEWDYQIEDYRRRWCTLHEIRESDEDPDFVIETLRQQKHLITGIRKRLNMLKPELLRKIKGVLDGDDIDLERTVEVIVERKSGFTPDERIYVQRQRKDRDVAALFLLDMSASTDDVIENPDQSAQEQPDLDDEDDFLSGFYGKVSDDPTGKKIIDLEKESVILMSEALEELGDNYSVCGFSGYGREQVEYYLCKDFDEPLNHRTRGRIGGIKPCRSTRMGPAIRHATRSLMKTECRVQVLIIISDGYPQDFDYGKDRNSREYGIMDTMKALTESRQQGVQSFCLTVDPSGNDYLRSMCPDAQYMVIQDIRQLPDELSKVYRSLTG